MSILHAYRILTHLRSLLGELEKSEKGFGGVPLPG